MAVRTWETIELPILEAVVGMEDAVRSVTVANIAEASGLSTTHVSHGLRRLADGGYVTGRRIHGTGLPFELIGVRATELARRATGQWPAADPYAELMLALELRIDATADLEARGKLERLRDAVAGVGRDVITGVLTALATSAIPK